MESADLISGVQQIFTDFQSAWYLGCTAVCYLIIQVLRGKAGFEVPWVTPKLEGLSKEAKTYIIFVVFGLVGILGAFGEKTVTFVVLADGFLKGLALGVGTVGTRSLVKQGLDGVQTIKENRANNNNQENK